MECERWVGSGDARLLTAPLRLVVVDTVDEAHDAAVAAEAVVAAVVGDDAGERVDNDRGVQAGQTIIQPSPFVNRGDGAWKRWYVSARAVDRESWWRCRACDGSPGVGELRHTKSHRPFPNGAADGSMSSAFTQLRTGIPAVVGTARGSPEGRGRFG